VSDGGSARVLDPIARISEVLFGLIMALTFTGTISVATADREEIRTLLIAVIGCNIAWGLVDAVMFLMSATAERGHTELMLEALRQAATPQDAHRLIAGAMPPGIAATLEAGDFEKVRRGLLDRAAVAPTRALTRADWLGAVAVFLLVFASTFPVVIPFLVFPHLYTALRVSNAVALVMMFASGWWLARHGGHHPWGMAAGVTLLGVVLVGITIALGG
jgi:hypothetical protein